MHYCVCVNYVLIAVSGNENAVGRLLKTESYRDRSCAGRVMEAVGKSQTYASQQMWDTTATLLFNVIDVKHVYTVYTVFQKNTCDHIFDDKLK